jgi:carbonic anhydrase
VGEDKNGMRFNPAEATMSLGMNSALSGGTKKPSTGSSSIQGALANTGPRSSPYGSIPDLFQHNRQWSERINTDKPDFFETLSKQQAPKFLWIGCSDSRVPANEVVDLRPGELFVHRNVANVVVHTDLNCLSVIQYAVDYLRVEHIIICGHYGCGGVKAALNGNRLGLIDNWLRHIVDVRDKHKWAIEACPYPEQLDLLCELNVIEQAVNICETTVVQDAWSRGQSLQVHSWIYGLDNGLLKDLGLHVSMQRELEPRYDGVLKRYSSTRT